MNFVVIGYGNSLRSDDGAGQIVANTIAEWELSGVKSLAVHQLTPELAENISQVDTVIFVDAVVTDSANPESVQIQKIKAADHNNSLGHNCDPRSLIAMTQILYGKVVTAYWVLIPAVNFDFGEQFSCVTKRAIDIALKQVKKIIDIKNGL
ncbi:MAG: hydrogenase maturation protease [Xenococcus sp. (in: cyanobacteria)]